MTTPVASSLLPFSNRIRVFLARRVADATPPTAEDLFRLDPRASPDASFLIGTTLAVRLTNPDATCVWLLIDTVTLHLDIAGQTECQLASMPTPADDPRAPAYRDALAQAIAASIVEKVIHGVVTGATVDFMLGRPIFNGVSFLTSGASTSPAAPSVAVAGDELRLVVHSETDRCWAIDAVISSNTVTTYGMGTQCDATLIDRATLGPAWPPTLQATGGFVPI